MRLSSYSGGKPDMLKEISRDEALKEAKDGEV